MERIQEVYQLVSRNQGQYDYETLGARTNQEGHVVGTLRPENLINSSEKYGTAGVCAHFAGRFGISGFRSGYNLFSRSVFFDCPKARRTIDGRESEASR